MDRLTGLILTLAAVLIGGLALYIAILRLRIRRLTGQMEDFLAGRCEKLAFSVREDVLAPLHNAAAELQERLMIARERERGEGERVRALMADISHQLKTPLATLRLYCEMDSGAHLSGEIEQIERMERLIYSLLRLERLCADGYDFDFAPHDAAALMRTAWQPLARLWPDRRFETVGSAMIRCDQKWLGEALGNLMKNACEHTQPGGLIEGRIEADEAFVTLTIEDDGGGVQPEALEHLFERFYRVPGGRTGGAGLGLAIAREVTERHHGRIEAENTARGLRVTITLPRLEERLLHSLESEEN